MAANAQRSAQQFRVRLIDADESNRDSAYTEAERDERRLGPEDESEAESRERGEQDAGEVDRAYLAHAQAFERRVPTVAGKPHCRGDEDAAIPGISTTYHHGGSFQSNESGISSQTRCVTSWIAVWNSTAAKATGTPSRRRRRRLQVALRRDLVHDATLRAGGARLTRSVRR